MKKIIYLYILFVVSNLYAQEGFVRTYQLNNNNNNLAFTAMEQYDDTIVVVGIAFDTLANQWGTVWAKIDTSGNIVNQQSYFDENGDSHRHVIRSKLTRTSDQGYVYTGNKYNTGHPFMIKLDAEGILEFLKTYPNNNSLTTRYYDIEETFNGFLLAGIKQSPEDGNLNGFLTYTNLEGDVLWNLSYGEMGQGEIFYSIKEINDNRYLITGSGGIDHGINGELDFEIKTIAIEVDTLGNILNEIGTDFVDVFGALYPPNAMIRSVDNNWITAASYVDQNAYTPFDDVLGAQPAIIKRDENMEVIWDTRFGVLSNFQNTFWDIAETADGGYAAAGYMDEPEDGWATKFLIAKVNPDGEPEWSFSDKVFWNPDPNNGGSHNYLNSIVTLESGSIIAAGYVEQLNYPDSANVAMGLLVKLDNRGCVEPGCNPAVNTQDVQALMNSTLIYPNPVQNELRIQCAGNFNYEVFDISGRLIQQGKENNGEVILKVEDWQKGSYVIRLNNGSRYSVNKIIKL